jgi:LPS O-antigen subunit length determinant protein (WzzB/FepE family)
MNKESEINVSSIFKSIIDSKKFIFLFSALFSVISISISLTLDDIYTSEIKLKYSDSFSTPPGQTGISLLDTFSLPGNTQNNKFVLERLKSRDFFPSLYKDNIFLKNLMAYDLYDKESKNNYYLSDVYNLEDKENPWINGKPSLASSHEQFIGSNLRIAKNRENGLITLTISHKSPYIAKEWSDKVLLEINTYISAIDRKKANDAYSFLSEQLNGKPVAQMAKTISIMIEKELNTLMLTEILDGYVFEIIENSAVPERKSYPSRSVIVLLTGLISFCFSCLLVVYLSFNDKKIVISLIPPKLKIQ